MGSRKTSLRRPPVDLLEAHDHEVCHLGAMADQHSSTFWRPE